MKILLDHAQQCEKTSCRYQPTAVRGLIDAGVEVRTYKPMATDLGSLHHKTTICDRTLLLNGSVNFTHNGFVNNEENLIVTNSLPRVTMAARKFEELWGKGRACTLDAADARMDEHLAEQRRDDRLPRSKSAQARVRR